MKQGVTLARMLCSRNCEFAAEVFFALSTEQGAWCRRGDSIGLCYAWAEQTVALRATRVAVHARLEKASSRLNWREPL